MANFLGSIQAHTGDPDMYVNLSGADLSDAKLNNAGFEYSCLSHIKCHRTDFSDVRIDDSSLYGADCTGALFTNAKFNAIEHTNAIMPGAVFQYEEDKVNLAGCKQ